MNTQKIQTFAKQLDLTTQKHQTLTCITAKNPSLTLDDAYLIQKAGIALRVSRGEKVVGYKMGLTSKAKQDQMHVDHVIYGTLMGGTRIPDEGCCSSQDFIHPKIEAEIAFILDKPLQGKVTHEEALAACSGVCAALDPWGQTGMALS